MLADKVITQAEYSEAYNETIKLKLKKEAKKNYIQTFITRCATRSIMAKNGFVFMNTFNTEDAKKEYQDRYDESYATAQKELFNSGYRIYTSIDTTKQEALQKSIDDNLTRFTDKTKDGVYKMQGAAVCIDNKTGRVVAVVGGRTQKTQGYTLNRAYQSYRQPGSSIKPLIVYTPSLERNYSPNSYVVDKKFKDGPKNSGGGYSGNITLRYAVEKSKNTVAWQLFDELTPEVGLSYLHNMNFGRIVESDNVLAASLGGLTYGCSPLEMASGYATIENEGKYREPTCIIKILNASGKEIVSDKVVEKQIYKANAANTMTDILTGVLKRGTGVGLGISNGMPCAGKTGTTNDKKDGWFCGFTPYYTTAVWIGYDQPQTVYDLYGNTYPGRTWKEFMNLIHQNLPIIQFPDYIDENADKVVKPSPTPGKAKPLQPEGPAVTTPPNQSPTPVAPTPTPDNTNNDTSNDNNGGGQQTQPSAPAQQNPPQQ
jgi:membrane peptidoglycan carboxypeptidase